MSRNGKSRTTKARRKAGSRMVRGSNSTSRRTTWLLVGAGAAMVAGKLMERGLDRGWRAWKDEDPPALEKGENWSQALAWAALSAAAVAGAELVARRGADLGLRRLSGKHAPAGL